MGKSKNSRKGVKSSKKLAASSIPYKYECKPDSYKKKIRKDNKDACNVKKLI